MSLHKSNPKNLVIRLSACCNAKVNYIQQSKICDECISDCDVKDYPLFEEVSRGCYRRINYPQFPFVEKYIF
jgi:hypothetical protein